MDNSLKTTEKTYRKPRAADAPRKIQNQNLPYRTTTKPNPKPESNPRIASAERRVKPLARLLRCATALPGDSAPRLRLKRLIWPFIIRLATHPRATRPAPPFSLINSHPFGSGRSSPGREAAQRTLDGEDRSGIIRDEGKRIQERGGRAGRGSPRRGLRRRPCWRHSVS